MDKDLEARQALSLSQENVCLTEILQKSAQELRGFIEQMALENPMMELEEPAGEAQNRDRLRKLEWLANLDEQNRAYYRGDWEEAESADVGDLEVAQENTLRTYLISQLMGKEYSDRELEIFDYIAGCLDSRGFFTGTAEEVAGYFKIAREKAERYIQIMKNLEPAGVCASSLEECLLKQLELKEGDFTVERRIVEECMELLGKNQLHAIARHLSVPIRRVQKALQTIKGLNPKPARGFGDREYLRYLVPDISVVKFENHYEILLNDYSYPAIHVSGEYLDMLKSDAPGDVKEYLSDKLDQIRRVQSCLLKRSSLLLELTKLLIEVQHDFFSSGKGHMKPYTMEAAAERLAVDVFVVSCAVRDKYLQCCQGIYPMNYFFINEAAGRDIGGEKNPSARIKEMILGLIEQEDKKRPCSDQKLTELLNEKGIDISRRTVAKYREAMKIGDCRERKNAR